MRSGALSFLAPAALAAACSSAGSLDDTSAGAHAAGGAGQGGAASATVASSASGTGGGCPMNDANCGGCGKACTGANHCVAGACQASAIEHVVLVVQENHTFDSYFGKYCQAPAGTNPQCTVGPGCCEHAPDKEPKGALPQVLDDASNFANDRDHRQACELAQIDGGKMDGFVNGAPGQDTCFGVGPKCASPNNWALADSVTVGPYWKLADTGALADRYFQPIAGSSSSNDMYFAIAHFQFVDNAIIPVAPGGGCSDPSGLCLDGKHQEYQGRTTIADLLLKAGKTFAVYADGWNEAVAAGSSCPSPSAQCPNSSCILHPVACNGCRIETADIPFAYYEQLLPYFKDYDEFSKDLDGGKLPSFSFIKPRSWRNEHPNLANITDGVTFVGSVLDHVAKSSFAGNTLLLVTWDEGGGFFDHVAPPAPIDKDDQNAPVPYGTRVPLLAIGPFARKGTVSHVTLEHSSIVRFLEYNFIGPTGQLGFNDAKVHNLGSLLDPAATVVTVPED